MVKARVPVNEGGGRKGGGWGGGDQKAITKNVEAKKIGDTKSAYSMATEIYTNGLAAKGAVDVGGYGRRQNLNRGSCEVWRVRCGV
jgi:hypothetical protein